jgi:hypothetical protein
MLISTVALVIWLFRPQPGGAQSRGRRLVGDAAAALRRTLAIRQ